MKHVIRNTLAASLFVAGPALAADDTSFDESVVAAMKNGIVIEAPWAVSMKDGEIIVFMLIHNSAESDKITGVTSEAADTATMAKFESPGMQKPQMLDDLETPGGEATSLDQDGYHLLLTDLTKDIESGDVIPVKLEFEENGELEVLVSVAVPQ